MHAMLFLYAISAFHWFSSIADFLRRRCLRFDIQMPIFLFAATLPVYARWLISPAYSASLMPIFIAALRFTRLLIFGASYAAIDIFARGAFISVTCLPFLFSLWCFFFIYCHLFCCCWLAHFHSLICLLPPIAAAVHRIFFFRAIRRAASFSAFSPRATLFSSFYVSLDFWRLIIFAAFCPSFAADTSLHWLFATICRCRFADMPLAAALLPAAWCLSARYDISLSSITIATLMPDAAVFRAFDYFIIFDGYYADYFWAIILPLLRHLFSRLFSLFSADDDAFFAFSSSFFFFDFSIFFIDYAFTFLLSSHFFSSMSLFSLWLRLFFADDDCWFLYASPFITLSLSSLRFRYFLRHFTPFLILPPIIFADYFFAWCRYFAYYALLFRYASFRHTLYLFERVARDADVARNILWMLLPCHMPFMRRFRMLIFVLCALRCRFDYCHDVSTPLFIFSSLIIKPMPPWCAADCWCHDAAADASDYCFFFRHHWWLRFSFFRFLDVAGFATPYFHSNISDLSLIQRFIFAFDFCDFLAFCLLRFRHFLLLASRLFRWLFIWFSPLMPLLLFRFARALSYMPRLLPMMPLMPEHFIFFAATLRCHAAMLPLRSFHIACYYCHYAITPMISLLMLSVAATLTLLFCYFHFASFIIFAMPILLVWLSSFSSIFLRLFLICRAAMPYAAACCWLFLMPPPCWARYTPSVCRCWYACCCRFSGVILSSCQRFATLRAAPRVRDNATPLMFARRARLLMLCHARCRSASEEHFFRAFWLLFHYLPASLDACWLFSAAITLIYDIYRSFFFHAAFMPRYFAFHASFFDIFALLFAAMLMLFISALIIFVDYLLCFTPLLFFLFRADSFMIFAFRHWSLLATHIHWLFLFISLMLPLPLFSLSY